MKFTYRRINSTCIEITGYTGREKDIIIPNKIDGVPVTHIGDWAFRGNQLQQVAIPNSVTHIGAGAFRGNQLQQVAIPNSVTHIGDWAFRGNQLQQVAIPNSVTHIGDWAFDGNQLQQVAIPNSVTHIGAGAFRGNVRITHLNHVIEVVDGIATIIRRKKTVDGFEIYSGKFFNSNRECYVAKRGEHSAHGDTIREAIEDVNFKYLQANFNADEIVKEVREKGVLSVSHFRLLTGACRTGCKNFLSQHGVAKTELPLNEALNLIRNQYGWDRISQYFN